MLIGNTTYSLIDMGSLVTNAFGELIERRRKELGITQEILEERSGVSQTHISKMKRGLVRNPSERVLEGLAVALDVPIAELKRSLGWVVEVVEVQPDEEVMVLYAGRVPADSVRWVEAEQEVVMRPVAKSWLGSRSPKDFLIVTASGDCLSARGIQSGTDVLLLRTTAVPPDGEIVCVRVGDEFALKEIYRVPRGYELRDGNGSTVCRIGPEDECELVGVYVAHWHVRSI